MVGGSRGGNERDDISERSFWGTGLGLWLEMKFWNKKLVLELTLKVFKRPRQPVEATCEGRGRNEGPRQGSWLRGWSSDGGIEGGSEGGKQGLGWEGGGLGFGFRYTQLAIFSRQLHLEARKQLSACRAGVKDREVNDITQGDHVERQKRTLRSLVISASFMGKPRNSSDTT